MTRSAVHLGVIVSLWCGGFGGWALSSAGSVGQVSAADNASQRTGGKSSNQEPSRPAAPPVTLIEGERVKAEEVMVLVKSTLLEEGDAVKQMAENEANINNVRYNINDYRIGYSIASEKANDQSVFRGPTKGWRAKAPGEVSIWPPVLYTASRKETMRQTKLMEPIPLAETLDEMNNLRVYYRPVLVDHDGEKYQQDSSALAFFIHPKSGIRMTLLFREGRSYGAVKDPLVANSKIFVKKVVPGRGRESSTLVPSIFVSKEVSIDAEPFPKDGSFDRLMQAVIAAHDKGTVATDDFKALYEEMSSFIAG